MYLTLYRCSAENGKVTLNRHFANWDVADWAYFVLMGIAWLYFCTPIVPRPVKLMLEI